MGASDTKPLKAKCTLQPGEMRAVNGARSLSSLGP